MLFYSYLWMWAASISGAELGKMGCSVCTSVLRPHISWVYLGRTLFLFVSYPEKDCPFLVGRILFGFCFFGWFFFPIPMEHKFPIAALVQPLMNSKLDKSVLKIRLTITVNNRAIERFAAVGDNYSWLKKHKKVLQCETDWLFTT